MRDSFAPAVVPHAEPAVPMSRRHWLATVPAAAATSVVPLGGLLAVAGAPGPVAAATPASGGFTVSPGTVGSWPSTDPLLPDARLTQACINGKEVHVLISHGARTGQLRTASFTLRSKLGWTEGRTLLLNVSGSAPDGTLEGTFVTAASPTALSRMSYGLTAGAVQATVSGGAITLVLSPTVSDVLVAGRLNTSNGNAAPTGSSVRVNYQLAAGSRTITLPLAVEMAESV